MNINSTEAFLRSHWDWTRFNDCFVAKNGAPTKIRIADIDGHVERNGHWLRIEGTEKEMAAGQVRSIQRDVARGTMVIVLIGQPNNPYQMMIFYPFADHPVRRQIIHGSLTHDPWFIIRGWFLWADTNGSVSWIPGQR